MASCTELGERPVANKEGGRLLICQLIDLTEVTRTMKCNAGQFSHDDFSQCLSFTSEGGQLWYKLRYEKKTQIYF